MRVETGIQICALNSMLIGMYKAKVLGFRCTQSFRYQILQCTHFAEFECTPDFSLKSMQVRKVPSLSRGVETEVGGLMGGTPVFCGKEPIPFACVCCVAGGAEGNIVAEEKI